MTRPRPKRTDTPEGVHPDDVWRPGEKARMARRLLAKLRQQRPPAGPPSEPAAGPPPETD